MERFSSSAHFLGGLMTCAHPPPTPQGLSRSGCRRPSQHKRPHPGAHMEKAMEDAKPHLLVCLQLRECSEVDAGFPTWVPSGIFCVIPIVQSWVTAPPAPSTEACSLDVPFLVCHLLDAVQSPWLSGWSQPQLCPFAVTLLLCPPPSF